MKDIKEYITEAVYDDTAQNRKLRRVGKYFNHDKSAKEKINSNGTVDLKGKRSSFKVTNVPIDRLKPDNIED